ncbi:MAG: DUF3761 domain-containing protein [Solirubrobacteraceae bacterium]
MSSKHTRSRSAGSSADWRTQRSPATWLCAAIISATLALGGCAQTSEVGSTAAAASSTASHAAASIALHLDVGSYSLESPSTTIAGTVTPGSTVTVNHHRASVHGRHWGKALQLRLGENRVTVEASLRGRRSARKTITLTREKSTAEIEAENHSREGETSNETTSQPTPGPSASECTNGTYVNSAGKTVCRPEESPTAPAGATAECVDGTYSFSESRSGTCSHHGGVARWLK